MSGDAGILRPTGLAQVTQLVRTEPALALYCGAHDCNVCQATRPRVWSLLAADFPRCTRAYVDATAQRETAAQLGVFAVPTLICFFGGQETLRLVRSLSLTELRAALARPYCLYFAP
jgi:thioredoxin-like negative regulator of GroEL